MKPSRGFLVWTALAVCAVLVIGAMTWLTRGVMQAGRDRIKADQERDRRGEPRGSGGTDAPCTLADGCARRGHRAAGEPDPGG